jgi:hypothetical protein
MHSLRALTPTLLLATLSACGAGGGGSNDFGINCAGLNGAAASAGAGCAGGTCSQTFTDAANDHDLDTYAILEMTDSASGNIHIRVTAADGVTYPAGRCRSTSSAPARTEA